MTSQLTLNIAGRLPIGGEFQGYNGDCSEFALMCASSAAAPVRYPCSAAELDRLTKLAIDNGEAAPSGAMTPAQIAWLSGQQGIAYQQQVGGDILAPVRTYAGQQGLVYTCTNGAALPGNEAGVQGHAVAILDGYKGLYTLANGDSVNGRAGKLDYDVPEAALVASAPYSLTRLGITVQGPYSQYWTVIAPNKWQVTSQPSVSIQDDELLLYQAANQAPGIALSQLNYGLQGKYGSGFAVRLYERAFSVYDPHGAYSGSPQRVGQWYLGKVTDPELGALFGIIPPNTGASLTINGAAPVPVSKVTVNYG